MVWQQRRFRVPIYQDGLKQILSRCRWYHDKDAWRHAKGHPNTSDRRFDEWEGRCWDESGTAATQDCRVDRCWKSSWEHGVTTRLNKRYRHNFEIKKKPRKPIHEVSTLHINTCFHCATQRKLIFCFNRTRYLERESSTRNYSLAQESRSSKSVVTPR
jgi:hypothetical protein